MRNHGIRIFLGCLTTLLLTACPYKSTVPVSPPNEPIEKDLLGDWISSSELEFTYPTFYKVDQHNENKYKVIENRFNATDSVYKEKTYFMHSTTIKDRTFLNLQTASANGYYIYLLNLKKSELTLTGLSESIDEQFSSSKGLEKFIKKYMNLSFFYEKSDEKFLKRTE